MAATGGAQQMVDGDATLTQRANAPHDANQVGSDNQCITWKPFAQLADLRKRIIEGRPECDQSHIGQGASRVANHQNQRSGDDL